MIKSKRYSHQTIVSLSKDKAFGLVDSLVKRIDEDYFTLGGVLAVILDKSSTQGDEEWLDGHASFRELCIERFGIRHRKAYYLVNIYKSLQYNGIAWDQVKDIGWTKLGYISRVLTRENASLWLKRARTWTTLRLQTAISSGDMRDVFTITFSVTGEQRDYLRSILRVVKREHGLSSDTEALLNVMMGYRGRSPSDYKIRSDAGKIRSAYVVGMV